MTTPDGPRRQALRRADRVRRRFGQGQVELHDDSAVAAAWGQEHPDAFGGLWFDNDDAGAGEGPVRLAVAVRRGTDSALPDALRGAVQHPDRLSIVACDRSLRELEALAGRIRERHMPDRAAPGTRHVLTLSIDVRAGSVEAGIDDVNGEVARQPRHEFAGEPVVIAVAPNIAALSTAQPARARRGGARLGADSVRG